MNQHYSPQLNQKYSDLQNNSDIFSEIKITSRWNSLMYSAGMDVRLGPIGNFLVAKSVFPLGPHHRGDEG